jgi:hypothetical protein
MKLYKLYKLERGRNFYYSNGLFTTNSKNASVLCSRIEIDFVLNKYFEVYDSNNVFIIVLENHNNSNITETIIDLNDFTIPEKLNML